MKNYYGNTPLHSAIKNNNNTTINLLLEGTSPEERLSPDQKLELLKMKNNNGNTPLSLAVYNKNTDTIKLLLEGTSPEEKLSPDQKIELLKMKNKNGNTPLSLAIQNKDNTTIEMLLKDLSAQQRVLLQINDPQTDYQVPKQYEQFIELEIDITTPYKDLDDMKQSMIDDALQSIMDHNPELLTSHIIPSYQKMKSIDRLDIHNNSKVQLLGMIENFIQVNRSIEYNDLIEEIRASIEKQNFTQEESNTFMMQDLSDGKIKDSNHYDRVKALRFIDTLTNQSSTDVSEEELSTLIDHAITELAQSLTKKAALQAIWQFRKQFSTDHLVKLEELLNHIEIYLAHPDPSQKINQSLSSKVTEKFDKTEIQKEQKYIKDIVQSLKDQSSNTLKQPENKK